MRGKTYKRREDVEHEKEGKEGRGGASKGLIWEIRKEGRKEERKGE